MAPADVTAAVLTCAEFQHIGECITMPKCKTAAGTLITLPQWTISMDHMPRLHGNLKNIVLKSNRFKKGIIPERIYNPITAIGFSAMFTFQLDNTKR